MNKLLTNPLFPILGALLLFVFAGGVLAGRATTGYPFTGYTTIPPNEPHPGKHVIPVPPISTIDFEVREIEIDDELEWYGFVTVNRGQSGQTVYEVDTHKLTFQAIGP